MQTILLFGRMLPIGKTEKCGFLACGIKHTFNFKFNNFMGEIAMSLDKLVSQLTFRLLKMRPAAGR